MGSYEILFVIGFILFILGMIPILYGFIKAVFEVIVDIKNHDYDMLPELLLSVGVIIMLIAIISKIGSEIK